MLDAGAQGFGEQEVHDGAHAQTCLFGLWTQLAEQRRLEPNREGNLLAAGSPPTAGRPIAGVRARHVAVG
jgi:hypothetical protein